MLTHTLSGNPLDRGDQQRRDEAWLDGAARDEAARFLPMWQLNVLLCDPQQPRLAWLSRRAIDQLQLAIPIRAAPCGAFKSSFWSSTPVQA